MENKVDFSVWERVEIGQFCHLVELNLELCTISLQTKFCNYLSIHFSVKRLCVEEYTCRTGRKMIRFKLN